MFKKKCSGCAHKIDRSFNFCPHCGKSIKVAREQEDFGMIGRIDETPNQQLPTNMGMPFGMDKIMNSLIKQLEKQLGNMDPNQTGMPKGIKIKFSPAQTHNQHKQETIQEKPKIIQRISAEEHERRRKLPKKDAKSRVRRLGDKIIYELETPGIQNKNDISIAELATGIEIKVYAQKNCYTKIIPLKVEIIQYYTENEKVYLEVKA